MIKQREMMVEHGYRFGRTRRNYTVSRRCCIWRWCSNFSFIVGGARRCARDGCQHLPSRIFWHYDSANSSSERSLDSTLWERWRTAYLGKSSTLLREHSEVDGSNFNRLWAQTKEVFGELHPDSLNTQNLRGLAFESIGDYDAAIKILRPLALTTVEYYGIGHNFTWRYLNNLAIVIEMKSDSPDISSKRSRTLKLQATSLLTQCIQQSMMHFSEDGIPWYINTFHEILPEYAPTEEELATWSDIVRRGLEIEFSHINYMSVLKLRALDVDKLSKPITGQ